MKKLIFLYFLAQILLLACSIDERDPNKFGELLFENLVSRKTDDIKALYLNDDDKNRVTDTLLNHFFNVRLKDTFFIRMYNARQEEEIKEWYKVAIDKEITKKNVSFLRTELDSSTSSYNTPILNFKIYFLLNNKEHFFTAEDIDRMKDGWTIYGITPPTNASEEKKRLENQPYKPFGLWFTNCNWKYSNYALTTFSNFYVTLSNNTGHDFDYIKFRVSLKTNKNGYEETVFSKTLERREKIYDKDVVKFEIEELRGFYIGVNINNEKNFDWDSEILDAKPRPEIK